MNQRTFNQPPGNYTEWDDAELDFMLRVAVRGVREAVLPEMSQRDLETHTEYLLYEATLRRLEDQARLALPQGPVVTL